MKINTLKINEQDTQDSNDNYFEYVWNRIIVFSS